MSDLTIVRATTDVAELARNALPLWAVGGLSASDRMGYLVQQNLMNLVVVELGGEVARNGDASIGVVAKACPPLRVIEAKRPTTLPVQRVEVQPNERLRPDSHPFELSHGAP